MTEHKFTDEEVIRALKCCSELPQKCTECTMLIPGGCARINKYALALDLINRQREDIDRLIEINTHNIVSQYKIKAEAIKEFAERLKALAYQSTDWSHGEHPMVVEVDDIDEIVEEMTRRCTNCKHFVGCEAACGGVACDMYDEDKKG